MIWYNEEMEQETEEELAEMLLELEVEVSAIRLRLAMMRKERADREYLTALEGVIFG